MAKKTATFYKTHPEARKKRLAYQKEYNKSDSQVKKRVELNRENRHRGHKGDGLDVSHTRSGLTLKPQSQNRGSRSSMPGDVRARGKKR